MPHELLNYFSFETAQVEPGDDFSVLADGGADPVVRDAVTAARTAAATLEGQLEALRG